ncbi:glycosyltransferase family 2 protein [Qipengyuania gelatinilytica]|uniref:Glycosyltransferase family 2 protein n=1 Tax=Qipengyuania gelatinilytica TaxID=2867231 RepID=A0ABX9A5D4_9SPHN|nr:glycosyltransferase family 2 protein [Qipengyuania gelatinilytica]QZD96495.1 glycosyltransferase family 2 protein [Qipengyuania gelatinilytica]
MLKQDFAPAIHAASAEPSVAVLLPCYNEGLAIRAVIERFQKALPQATIYVYDNNSSDDSAAIARAAGAVVRSEPRQGKGFVVRRMFADIDADIYLMCDADETYEAEAAPALVDKLVEEGLDMVVGSRSNAAEGAYRPAHKFGNWMLTSLVRTMFGNGFKDMLSGYRVFSRRFVKSFPVMAQGFEIETELTIHALQLEMPAAEVPTQFSERPEGSESKLNTISDGLRILWTITGLLKQERPLYLYGMMALGLFLASLVLGFPVIAEYVETGLVPRLPTALLASGVMILAFLSLFSGLILDTVTRGRKEAKRLRYLQLPSVLKFADERKLIKAA